MQPWGGGRWLRERNLLRGWALTHSSRGEEQQSRAWAWDWKKHSQERIKIAGQILPARINCRVECVILRGMFDADNCSCLCSSKGMENSAPGLPNFHFPLSFFGAENGGSSPASSPLHPWVWEQEQDSLSCAAPMGFWKPALIWAKDGPGRDQDELLRVPGKSGGVRD